MSRQARTGLARNPAQAELKLVEAVGFMKDIRRLMVEARVGYDQPEEGADYVPELVVLPGRERRR